MNPKAFVVELSRFQELLADKEIVSIMVTKSYQKEMMQTALLTLENIHILINEYIQSYQTENSKGDKGLLIFGLLQGLFVGIDALYTIGKITKLNKLMINLNQNTTLRQIKHIRNDVVGHPTYRLYEQDQIGFCALDFDHIDQAIFHYKVFLQKDNQLEITKKQVNMIDVINDFYREATYFIQDTSRFFYLKKNQFAVNLSLKVHLLAIRYQNHQTDYSLLEEIEKSYQEAMHSQDNHTNRVLWRIRLIRFLFDQTNPNEYVTYLTYIELYKLYSLFFHLEKELNQNPRFHFLEFSSNNEFNLLRNKIIACPKKIDRSILHDSFHPLYEQTMDRIFSCFSNQEEVQALIAWIKEQVKIAHRDMLYLIGSELKK